MCACTHMHVSLCAYLCVCESFAFTFGADSCKPHGLVSSRHRTAVGTAWSNLWLPLLACLATGCGGNVNEGRVSGPTASCRGCDICLLNANCRGPREVTYYQGWRGQSGCRKCGCILGTLLGGHWGSTGQRERLIWNPPTAYPAVWAWVSVSPSVKSGSRADLHAGSAPHVEVTLASRC